MNLEEDKKSNKVIKSSRIVSERGQTVIPKPIRDYMDLKAGDRVEWIVNENGAIYVHPIKKKSILDLKGIVQTQYPVSDFDEEASQSKEDYYRKKNELGGAVDD